MTKTKPPMKSRRKKKTIDMEAAEKFAAEADKTPVPENKADNPVEPDKSADTIPVEVEKELLPWEVDGLNTKVIKPFNIRPNEIEHSKIKFVVDNTSWAKSMQQFCLQVVLERVEARIKELTD